MKAYSIDSTTQEVKELDIEMQANTVYSFFNSILTDELATLDKHTIHSDADAISKNMEPFFIGEQLIVGNALIVGKEGLFDTDASIPKDDLESLVNYEVTQEQEDIKLNTEWVLYVFNMADDRTKEYFLEELTKAIEAKKDITIHMQNMAILALNATAKQ
jgi:hypothetical protein